MKKQILNKEFLRMQKLAGILTEEYQLNEDNTAKGGLVGNLNELRSIVKQIIKEETINIDKGFSAVDFDAKKSSFGINSKWHKQNLPFNFTSPLSNKEYNITQGRVRTVVSHGKNIFNLVLYAGGVSSDISIMINNIHKDDDIVTIDERGNKKNLYIKNLPEKDIIYKIIKDIKSEIGSD